MIPLADAHSLSSPLTLWRVVVFFLTWPHKEKGAKMEIFQLHAAEKIPLFLFHGRPLQRTDWIPMNSRKPIALSIWPHIPPNINKR